MSDTIGRIAVPSPVDSGLTFPLVSDFGYGFVQDRPVIVHSFGSREARTEQRFQVGIGPRKFSFRRQILRYTDRNALMAFWEARQGSWGSFTYNAPNPDKTSTAVKVNFEYVPISIQYLATACQVGINFIEVIDPAAAPSYSVASTSLRFPSSTLKTALLSQVQQIIPLVHIRVREGAVPDIYLSDRRCTVGGQLYQARVQNYGEPGSDTIMSQNINGAADDVQFTLANADRVITLLSNDTDLKLASIDVSLYHVNSGILLQLWKGVIRNFVNDGSPSFSLQATDGIYQITQQHPTRVNSRTCYKIFDDGVNCPYAAQSTNHGGNPTVCDFYFDSTNGCQVHGMDKYFGGHPASPQGVFIIDNSTSSIFGRNAVTATSLVSNTVWGNALKEIYCNDGGDAGKCFQVNCDIIAGRDESEFYDALGIVGAGPIGQFTGQLVYQNSDGYRFIIAPMLDGQTAHGFKVSSQLVVTSDSTFGLREIPGTDPQNDTFSLSQTTGAPAAPRAAGTAFVEIRRTDVAGIQPTTTESHQMTVPISKGLSGYTWNSGGTRTLTSGLVNPFWVAVNTLLRDTGLFQGSSSDQLATFVLPSLNAGDGSGSAEIADNVVTKLVGSGTETQFQFQGVLGQQKPLRDWLTEILSCCLGYFTFEFGKMKLGCRENASAVEAFTIGNILFQSLRLEPIDAQFERLIIEFADQAYQYQANTAEYEDKTHSQYFGRPGAPLTSRMHSVGGPTLSQNLRIAATRTREEVGGINAAEWSAARMATWGTTILALNTEVGQVVSMTHDDMPGGAGNFRILSWRLKKDYSIEIQGRSVTASMYDLTVGPKPMDVVPDPLPPLLYPIPFGPAWAPFEIQAASNDALFPGEYSFLSDQEYVLQADGTPAAELIVTGRLPVTAFIPNCPPPAFATITQATTGGSIPGNTTWRVTFSALDANGLPSPSAQIAIIQVPAGTSTNQIVLSDITWPPVAGLATFEVFVSDNDQLICAQQTGALTDTGSHIYTPGTITINGPFARSTWALPSPFVANVRIKAKRLRHSGVAGVGVTSVSANTIVSSDMIDASGTPFSAVGRIISVIGRPIGATPFASFLITAHVPATGTFTVTPDPVGVVLPFDAIVIRNLADAPNSAPFTSITDSGYQNSTDGYTGLDTTSGGAEKGSILRVIQGLSRGELRKLTGNTATTLNWDLPLPLDLTSVWIVEEQGYTWKSDASDVGNADSLKSATVAVPVTNLLQQPVLLAGFTVDINGVESPDGLNPIREDWVFGSQGTREVFADTTQLVTDGVILCDTTAGQITVQLLSFALAPNVLLIIQKISSDANAVVILPATGEAFEDGTVTMSLLAEGDSQAFKFHGN